MKLSCIRLFVLCLMSQTVFANTEIEVGLNLLSYENVVSEIEFSDPDRKQEITSSELNTFSPNIDFEIYANTLYLMGSVAFDADSKSNSIAGGLNIAPNMYAGLRLDLSKITNKTDYSTEFAQEDEKTTEDITMVGPEFWYRSKSKQDIFKAGIAFAQASSKTEEIDDEDGIKSTVETKHILLELNASYYYGITDRIYLGSGLIYGMTLSGDAKFKRGDTTTKADTSLSGFILHVAQLKIDL